MSASFRDAVDGAAAVQIQAATIRELLRKLVEQYPRLSSHLDDGIAVSIDGNIYRDQWGQSIPEGAEVYLLPRIPGG